jgi:DNA-binding transcriptional regulator YhcF (GntR family)
MLSKVDVLKDVLLKEIHSGKLRTGDVIPSRNRLKQKYGFSLTTVNKAIRDLTAAGYLSAVKGSVTRVLSEKPLVEACRIYAISGFNDSNLDVVRETLYSYSNISWPFIGLREEDAILKFDEICRPGTIVIWMCPNMKAILLMEHLEHNNIPQIIINRDFKAFNFVSTETHNSIREGLSWLMIEAGREISFVAPSPGIEASYIYQRINSFYEAVLELGAKLSPSMIFMHDQEELSAVANDIGRKLFLGNDRPRGIFVMHARLAILLVTFARAYNLLPGRDYHMLVFDYVDELRMTPGVCMMRQQLELMYREVNSWLENPFRSDNRPLQKYIKTELVTP